MNAQPNLSSQQWRILEFLAQATDWYTRQDMYAFVGTEKGYSKALGAPTGKDHRDSLEARGLVERRDPIPFTYKITAEGRRVLEGHRTGKGTARQIQPGRERSAVETGNIDRSDNQRDHAPTQVVLIPIARPMLKDDDIVRSSPQREAPPVTASIRDQLFSVNPLVRLNCAASVGPSMVAVLMHPNVDWIQNAFGAANAWIVVVGPSPGTGPGGKVDRPVLPVLGEVLPEFGRFAQNDPKGFWHELFRLLRQGFKCAGVATHDPDAALKLMMEMNLDTTPQGNSGKIPPERLTAGLARLKRVLDLTRPRLILALSADVYDVISRWNVFTDVGPERKHNQIATKNTTYTPRSRWLTYDNGARILLTKTVQHPSKSNFYLGFENEVSDSLGDRIAEAAS